jgi:hypothetical protein
MHSDEVRQRIEAQLGTTTSDGGAGVAVAREPVWMTRLKRLPSRWHKSLSRRLTQFYDLLLSPWRTWRRSWFSRERRLLEAQIEYLHAVQAQLTRYHEEQLTAVAELHAAHEAASHQLRDDVRELREQVAALENSSRGHIATPPSLREAA